jgi:signal transduction histidine kinase
VGELRALGEVGQTVSSTLDLETVLTSIVSHAGRIGINARQADGSVEISVTDTRIGIALQDQAKIFEEFRQAGSDNARKIEGTGLGLTLAKKFVELHGRKNWLTSAAGKGSSFTFSLPITAAM